MKVQLINVLHETFCVFKLLLQKRANKLLTTNNIIFSFRPALHKIRCVRYELKKHVTIKLCKSNIFYIIEVFICFQKSKIFEQINTAKDKILRIYIEHLRIKNIQE